MSGELPEGWVETAFEPLIASSFYGPRFSSEDYTPTGVPTIRTTDMNARGHIDLRDAPRVSLSPQAFEKFRLLDGDLLVTRTGTIGRCAVYTADVGPAIPSAYLIRFRLHPDRLDPRFALLFLQSPSGQAQLGLGTTAVAQPNINARAIGAFSLNLPPPPEQRRIVEAVEALLEQVNRARERLDRVPIILKRFRQAVLAVACSGDLTASNADREVEGPFDFLATLPKGWRWVAAADACDRLVDCHNKTAPYSDAGIRLLRTTNIRNGELALDDERYVTQETYDFWSRRCPPESGDVLFTREAPMGEAAMIPPGMKVCMGQRMMLLRANDKLISRDYLLLAVQAPYVRKYAEQVAVGSGVLHMRVGDVERLPLPVPPRAEQDAIVRRAKQALSLVSRLERRVAAATARADKLPQAILSKAFSGELVPTEADLARAEGRTYETAAELLARVAGEKDTNGVESSGSRRAPRAGRASKEGAG